MTVIAEFLFGLGFSKVDPKPLDDAEKKAKDAAKRMREEWASASRDIGKSFAIVGASATGAAFGIFKLAESSARAADEIGDTAVALGTTGRELQRLRHGMQIAGGNVEGFDRAVKKWTSGLSDAASKGVGPVADRLAQLGVSVGELQSLGLEDQIALISDRFQGLASEQEQAAVAADLFGAKADIKQLLERTGAGVHALGDEAERLGLVMSQDALDAAGDFADELDRLRAMLGAIVRDVGLSIMPTVRQVIDMIRDWAERNRDLIKTRLEETIRAVSSALLQLLPALTTFLPLLAKGIELAAKLAESVGPAGMAGSLIAMRGAAAGALGPVGALAAAFALLASSVLSAAEETQNLQFLLDDFKQGGRGKRGEGARFVASKREGDLQATRRALTAQLDQIEAIGGARTGGASGSGEQAFQRDRAKIVGQIRQLDNAIAKERAKATAATDFDADVAKRSAELEQRTQGRIEAKKAADEAARKGKGGGKRKAFEEDLSEFDFAADEAFGAEIRRLAESSGVGEVAFAAAIKSGGESLKAGSSIEVARQAARSRLGGLAGKDFGAQKDPLLSEIFGEDVPDIELSSLAVGAQPQTLVVTITNNFDVDVANEINGAGNPAEVASQVNATVDRAVRNLVADATRTVKLRQVR